MPRCIRCNHDYSGGSCGFCIAIRDINDFYSNSPNGGKTDILVPTTIPTEIANIQAAMRERFTILDTGHYPDSPHSTFIRFTLGPRPLSAAECSERDRLIAHTLAEIAQMLRGGTEVKGMFFGKNSKHNSAIEAAVRAYYGANLREVRTSVSGFSNCHITVHLHQPILAPVAAAFAPAPPAAPMLAVAAGLALAPHAAAAAAPIPAPRPAAAAAPIPALGSAAAASADSLAGEDRECIICRAQPKTHTFVPCGHLCICQGCSLQFPPGKNCPMCRTPNQMVMKVFV